MINSTLKFTVSIILTTLIIIIGILTIPFTSVSLIHEHNEAKKTNPCYTDGSLRVQIGSTIFKLPRRNIVSVEGPDIQWEGEPNYSSPRDGHNICQKENDPPLQYNKIFYSLNIKNCPEIAQHNGACSTIYGHLLIRKDTKNSQDILRKENIQKCKNDPIFNFCKHTTNYKNTIFHFQYSLKSYPLDDIKNTERMIIDYFKARDITETVKGGEEQTNTIEKAAP